jgi:hypothetical protein
MSHPSSESKISQARIQQEAGGKLCLAYSPTMKIVVICSAETSVEFQHTTWLYIPEDKILHNQRCENLKFYKKEQSFSMQFKSLLFVQQQ